MNKISFRQLIAKIVAVFFIVFSIADAEISLSGWKTYSSILDTKTGEIDSRGNYWLGTSGGVYNYLPGENKFEYYDNLNGLLTLDISCIKSNPNGGDLFIGGIDGNIDIRKSDGSWLHITDIKNSRFTEPRINDVLFYKKNAFIAGGFGISMFDLENNVFIKTPPRFGSFPSNTGVRNAVILGDVLYVSTKYGLASVNLNSSIIIPDNWKNYTEKNGLKSVEVLFIAEQKGELFVGTKNAIHKLVGDTFSLLMEIPDWTALKGLEFYDDQLVFATDFTVTSLQYKQYYHIDQTSGSPMINSFVSDGKSLIVCLKEAGFYEVNSSGGKHVLPNSPISSNFSGMTVDSKGVFWSATGSQPQGRGISKLENEKWDNYINKVYPEMKSNYYYKASSDDAGNVFFSSWGSGLGHFRWEGDTYKIFRYDTSNSPLFGVSGDPAFIVTGECATDRRNGLTWVVNYTQNGNGPLLVAFDQSGKFYSFVNLINQTNRDFISMAIDNNGTKWVGSTQTGTTGLYFFNEMNTLENTSDDKFGTYSPSNSSLPVTTINCLATDQSGVVWIGTPSGAAVILNPSAALRNANPIIRKVNILSANNINAILVDAINQKWVATNEGVWVINSDGTEVIAYISTKNSPLISDEVISLATDINSGRVFMGTKIGMTAVNTLSIKAAETYNLNVYPQPYHPEKDNLLTIDGLASDTEISIVTSSGEPVRTLRTTSRTAVWDGKDKYGNPASTGIYLILTASASGGTSSVGKFALIRE